MVILSFRPSTSFLFYKIIIFNDIRGKIEHKIYKKYICSTNLYRSTFKPFKRTSVSFSQSVHSLLLLVLLNAQLRRCFDSVWHHRFNFKQAPDYSTTYMSPDSKVISGSHLPQLLTHETPTDVNFSFQL